MRPVARDLLFNMNHSLQADQIVKTLASATSLQIWPCFLELLNIRTEHKLNAVVAL